MKTAIETYSGLFLDYLDPQPEQIHISDIARGLAHTCRFAGQTTRFYSVAEHAVYVSRLVETQFEQPDLALAALHHDDHEAYMCDWPTPLKEAIGREVFEDMCGDIDRAIARQVGVLWIDFYADTVKQADLLALRHEAATLKYSHGIGSHWGFDEALPPLVGIGWSPDKAEREYMKRHEALLP